MAALTTTNKCLTFTCPNCGMDICAKSRKKFKDKKRIHRKLGCFAAYKKSHNTILTNFMKTKMDCEKEDKQIQQTFDAMVRVSHKLPGTHMKPDNVLDYDIDSIERHFQHPVIKVKPLRIGHPMAGWEGFCWWNSYAYCQLNPGAKIVLGFNISRSDPKYDHKIAKPELMEVHAMVKHDDEWIDPTPDFEKLTSKLFIPYKAWTDVLNKPEYDIYNMDNLGLMKGIIDAFQMYSTAGTNWRGIRQPGYCYGRLWRKLPRKLPKIIFKAEPDDGKVANPLKGGVMIESKEDEDTEEWVDRVMAAISMFQ